MAKIVVNGSAIVWSGDDEVSVTIDGTGTHIGSTEFIPLSVAANPVLVTGVTLPEDYGDRAYTYDDGFVAVPAPDGLVAVVQALADKLLDPEPGTLGDIDKQAEVERGRYTTLAWAQEKVYVDKESEAVAWTANNSIDPGEIPYLTAEAAATSTSVATLAATYIANGAAWRAISVGIEARRMGLKAAVRAALLIATREEDPDPEAAMTALQAIDIKSGWPSL